MKRLIMSLGLIAVVAAVVGQAATAAAPTIEHVTVNDVGVVDEFLSDACGVPVTIDAVGHITIRTFDGTGTGLRSVSSINIAITAYAGDNVYRFRDVGADTVRVAPDGTSILMIIGQIPFFFSGVLKVNEDTGEAILVPQHSTEERLDAACAVLTA